MSGKYWDRAWSLVEECAPVSEGCRNCWARAMDARFGRPWTGAVRFREDRLNLPARTGKQTLWAVWNDLFHASVSDQQVWWALGRMTLAPQHVFLVLTKRPERVAELLGGIQLSDNVWIGVSVEDQGRLGRVRTLAAIGAAHRFVSVEPMLGMVEFDDDWWESANRVGWVICGGETGPGARPCDPKWIHFLKSQCDQAGVPFWFKGGAKWFDARSGKPVKRPADFEGWRGMPGEVEAVFGGGWR